MGFKQFFQKLTPGVYAWAKRRYWGRLIEKHKKMSRLEIEEELRALYRERVGCELNLNNPRRYTEKIQWCKLHALSEKKSELADKYAVRKWVAERIGEEYLIPLIGVWEKPEDIDFDVLPTSFVLKANHASGTNLIVKDKAELDLAKTRKMLSRWLNFDVGWVFFEVHYNRIKPLLIAERLMTNEDGSEINDYKFTCMDGRVRFIRVDCDRFGDHTCMTFDRDWNVQAWIETKGLGRPKVMPKKPKDLNKLIDLVEILAADFACVRVDFYIINEKFYFGEMTFTASGGYKKIVPDEYDYKLGDLWDISKEPVCELVCYTES